MLGWALTFLVVALIAGVLGFTTIAGAAIDDVPCHALEADRVSRGW